jgi:hypothetical protein
LIEIDSEANERHFSTRRIVPFHRENSARSSRIIAVIDISRARIPKAWHVDYNAYRYIQSRVQPRWIVRETPSRGALGHVRKCATPRAFALVWARLPLFLDSARNDIERRSR